jgi:hypothetical protein
MTYPAFRSHVFPKSLVEYQIPLFRPVRTQKTHVIFSVDWEMDHGRWRQSGDTLDYGGIRRATPVLCELLDELGIPSTWFVECNSRDRRLDMAAACAEQLDSIVDRPRDEIGLHLH